MNGLIRQIKRRAANGLALMVGELLVGLMIVFALTCNLATMLNKRKR